MENKIEMVIFDMDGVIMDSEPLHCNAKIEVLDELKLQCPKDLLSFVGKPNKVFWKAALGDRDVKYTYEELEFMQYVSILKQMKDKDVRMSSGLRELIQFLKLNGIKTAVASSSNRYYIDKVLKYYGLENEFLYTAGGDEVKHKKPEPDVYLKVLEISNVPAENVIAIEDSWAGCQAAFSAGIKCIGYRNPTSGNQDLSKSVYQIDKLEQVKELLQKELQIC